MNSPRKIGIMTFWGVPNYGAYAQAYALNKVCRQLAPQDEILHIAWLHPKHRNGYYGLFRVHRWMCRQELKQLHRPSFWLIMGRRLLQGGAYSDFWRDIDKIPHTKKMTAEELTENRFDIVVTGSDTIWDFEVPLFAQDPYLFGIGIPHDRLTAYAACFGSVKPTDAVPEYAQSGLQQYDYITVRDENSAEIVNQVIGELPQVVLDPTLLWNFPQDRDIPPPQIKMPYILVYGGNFPKELVNQVQEYAKSHGLRIVGTGCSVPWADENLPYIAPLQWISSFAGAACTVTCTFHGLMFSVIYHRPVVFWQMEYVRNRSESLLELFQWGDRHWKTLPSVERILAKDWSYTAEDVVLSRKKQASMEQLEQCL